MATPRGSLTEETTGHLLQIWSVRWSSRVLRYRAKRPIRTVRSFAVH